MNTGRKQTDKYEEYLEKFFEELLPEWNLRLLLETETAKITAASPPQLLWVDSITVTAYEPAPSKRTFGNLAGRIWNRFMRIWSRTLRLEKVKYPAAR